MYTLLLIKYFLVNCYFTLTGKYSKSRDPNQVLFHVKEEINNRNCTDSFKDTLWKLELVNFRRSENRRNQAMRAQANPHPSLSSIGRFYANKMIRAKRGRQVYALISNDNHARNKIEAVYATREHAERILNKVVVMNTRENKTYEIKDLTVLDVYV